MLCVTFLGNSQVFLEVATYYCDEGYYLEGHKTLTCLADEIYGDLSTGT